MPLIHKLSIALIFLTGFTLAACTSNVQTEEPDTSIRLQSVTCYSGGTVIHRDEGVAVRYIESSGIWYTRSDGIRVRARADCIVQDMEEQGNSSTSY